MLVAVADGSGGAEDLGASGGRTPFVAEIECLRKTGLSDLYGLGVFRL